MDVYFFRRIDMFHVYIVVVENGKTTIHSQGLKYNVPRKDEFFIVSGQLYVATEVCWDYNDEEVYVSGTRMSKVHVNDFVPEVNLRNVKE